MRSLAVQAGCSGPLPPHQRGGSARLLWSQSQTGHQLPNGVVPLKDVFVGVESHTRHQITFGDVPLQGGVVCCALVALQP